MKTQDEILELFAETVQMSEHEVAYILFVESHSMIYDCSDLIEDLEDNYIYVDTKTADGYLHIAVYE